MVKGVRKMNIQKNFYKLKNITLINYKDVLNQIISTIGILLIIIQLVEIVKSPLKGTTISILIINNILIFITIIAINIYSFINKRNALKLEVQNKNLTELNDKVRCFRHDFNNIMQAIDGYIVLHDIDSLQTYFNSLIKECNYVNSIEFLNNRFKENPAIYSVLLSKYRIAEEKDIKMNIEVLVDLTKFKKKSYMISRMVGILLDNALEACIEAEEKIVNVSIVKEEFKNKILIKIENTYINKEVDLSKIFEKDYSTKSGNTGLGLWKVRDILRQDEKLDLFTTKDEQMFRQQLEIYG